VKPAKPNPNGRGTTETLRKAFVYHDAGLSLVPVARDGTKVPDWTRLPRIPGEDGNYHAVWDPLKKELPTREDVERMFKGAKPPGIGVIGGAVSGGLECIDFDREAETIFPAWSELVEAERPGLVARLSIIRTPRPGYHVRYRCPDVEIPGNTKLAVDPAAPPDDRCLIETRGEGGYALAPGSPAECHQTGRPYEHHSGPELEHVLAISDEEREVLIRCARSFDRSAPAEPSRPAAAPGTGLSPGDDYDQRGPDWLEILEPHGWVAVRQRGEVTYWRRPGKDGPGWSATTGVCNSKAGRALFAVFSSNAHPFPGPDGNRPCSTHDKFGVYTLLNHGRDFRAAAQALAAEGYGEQRRDGQTGANPGDADAERPAAKPIRFEFIDSATFARTAYRQEWHIRRILAKGQPGVAGGPKKALKTSILVDMAISLGTATSFLGEFVVPAPVRVAFLSGESGEAALKDTAVRVCAARGLDLEGANVLWGFRLPQLADRGHLAALQSAIRTSKVEVLMLDPLYLSLLAGTGAQGLSAANMYQTGPLLMAVSQACLEVGCTPILAHHFRTTRANPYDEPQLEDLAFSGIQEYARQWVLLGRRRRYEPGTGQHRLWLSVGGSAGHSGLWAVDVEEGAIDEDFCGRTWDVTVTTATAERQAQESERTITKRQEKALQDLEDETALLQALDRLDQDGAGAGWEDVRREAQLSRDRLQRAQMRLRQRAILEDVSVSVRVGNGAARPAKGLRRCPE
jgi:hypothetical protein